MKIIILPKRKRSKVRGMD